MKLEMPLYLFLMLLVGGIVCYYTPAFQIPQASAQTQSFPVVAEQGKEASPVAAKKHKHSIQCLLNALREKESSGDDYAVGDKGKAKGPLQIWRAYWTDACWEGDVEWSYNKYVWDWEKSQQIVRWYWQRYAWEEYQRGDLESLARCHNAGGPQFRKVWHSTDEYWADVKRIMDNE